MPNKQKFSKDDKVIINERSPFHHKGKTGIVSDYNRGYVMVVLEGMKKSTRFAEYELDLVGE